MLTIRFVVLSLLAMALRSATASQPAESTKPLISIAGKITYQGQVPLSRLPNDVGVQLPLIEINAKGEWKGVVVYLDALEAAAATPSELPPKNAKREPIAPTLTIDQHDMRFVPRLGAIRHGQFVRFTNSDAANHNVRASSFIEQNQFNVFTGAGGSYDHRFAADPKQRPVQIGCDIHAWMRAWVYVFDHPRFAVSDDRGNFQIPSLAPGRYRLELRHPDVGLKVTRELTLPADPEVQLEFTFRGQDLKLN